jgi:predicted DNA-binding transcriptional regulator YafY
MEKGNNKFKILYIYELLNKFSDEEHLLSTEELCDKLKDRGIAGERKSIYRDISILKDYGADIISTRTPKVGFFLARRSFQLPEVRLLMDAVLPLRLLPIKKQLS